MLERDYIKRMMESLARLIAELTGMNPPRGLDHLEDTYRKYLKIDQGWLESLEPDALLQVLLEEKGFHVEQLEFLGTLLMTEGKFRRTLEQESQALECFKKALHLLQYVQAHSDMFSMEREGNISILRKQTKEIE